MDSRFERRLRPIAAVTLFFFTWISVEPWNYAAWAQLRSDSNVGAQFIAPASKNQKSKTPSEKFEESLRAAKKVVEELDQDVASGKDVTLQLESLKGHRQTLETADLEIRAEFAATEKFLKDKKLPLVILDRQAKVVADYDANYKTLRANLDGIIQLEADRKKAESQNDRSLAQSKRNELKAKLKAAKDHLAVKVKEPRHQKLDPNNLPHRTAKPTNKKPRLKKEEFKNLVGENDRPPVLLAYNGDPTALLVAQNTQDLPTPADLAETIEVQFTPDIQAKAAELEHNPVKIYNWVHNNIDFVPTYGSIQGARMCLLTKQCNDMDTASLLIALLRTSGIAARYVYGTIEVPMDKVMNWVGGFTDSTAALSFIGGGGIPVTGLISGGKFSAVQMEHTWVEAYVDYIPSRGAVHKQGDTWLPMDGSFKQFGFVDSLNFPSAVGFDPNAFVAEIQRNVVIDPGTGSATGIPQNLVLQRVQEYVQNVQQFLSGVQGKPFVDIFGAKTVIKQEFSILPSNQPYKVIVIANKFSEISDNLRHKVSFEITSESFVGTELSYSASLPQLAEKRITLAYEPATSTDATLIQQYGSIERTPPYLLHLKPQLKIDGLTVATGIAVGAGQELNLVMTFSFPDGSIDRISNIERAGAYLSVGLNLSQIPKVLFEKRMDLLTAARASVNSTIDDKVGETLFILSLIYFAESDLSTALTARIDRVAYSRLPSEAIVGEALKISSLFSIPTSMSLGGMFIDVDRDMLVPISRDGNKNKSISFMQAAGFSASSMEHAVFEQTYNVGAVSAVKVLQLANANGVPIFRVDQSNLSSILPLLQISDSMKSEIQNHVNVGNVVTVPQKDIRYFDWVGSAYIAMNPETGAAGYIVSGGLAGGFWSLLLDCLESIIQVVDLLPIGNPILAVIVELLAFSATLHDISQVPLDPVSFNVAVLFAVISALAGLFTIITPLYLTIAITVVEVILYVNIFVILNGGLPSLDGGRNPFSACIELLRL